MSILKQDPETGFWTQFDHGARLTGVHDPSLCAERGCAIHNHPSDHSLKDAPMNWRADRGILERICKHGIGHNDYDSTLYERSVGGDDGWHGCDGCCL